MSLCYKEEFPLLLLIDMACKFLVVLNSVSLIPEKYGPIKNPCWWHSVLTPVTYCSDPTSAFAVWSSLFLQNKYQSTYMQKLFLLVSLSDAFIVFTQKWDQWFGTYNFSFRIPKTTAYFVAFLANPLQLVQYSDLLWSSCQICDVGYWLSANSIAEKEYEEGRGKCRFRFQH